LHENRSQANHNYQNLNGKKENLGLTNFRGVKPHKEEIVIAKNYLTEEELIQLNALVEQYLIFAAEQARRRIPMYMKDWIEKLHGFLSINDRNILQGAGKIAHELMLEIADKEYNIYRKNIKDQEKSDVKIAKDFDEGVEKIKKIARKKKIS
jgi:hypothetical protein